MTTSTFVEGNHTTRMALRGSIATVTEFFGFAVNNILHQRGVYPTDTFVPVNKYELPLMVSTDAVLNGYLGRLLGQIATWIANGLVQQLVVVITSQVTRRTLERWTFDVDLTGGMHTNPHKTAAGINKELQMVMRQINSSVTMLPPISEPSDFDVLVYTEPGVDIPEEFDLSDPQLITDGVDVKLRTFSTQVHQVEGCVTYLPVE